VEALLSFIGEIYQAPCRSEHWHHVFADLCRKLDAQAGGLYVEDHRHQGNHYTLVSHAPPLLAQALVREDATSERAFAGHIAMITKVFPHTASSYLPFDKGGRINLVLYRGFDMSPFTSQERQLLDTLLPHFQRALRIQQALQQARSFESTLWSTFSRLPLATLVLDHDNKVIYRNASARRLLAQHPALRLKGDQRLHVHHASESRTLFSMITHLQQSDSNDVEARNLATSLHHPDRNHPLTVILASLSETPLGAPASPAAPNGRVALYLADPASPLQCSPDSLIATFGLTQREAEVAIALANGLCLQEISDQQQLGKETIRSQLKVVFRKLGVKRQQDVIRLILSTAL